MKPVFEHVHHSLSVSFASHHFSGRVFDCPYHIHPEVEVLRIESSEGRFLAGDHAGRFGPGDLFLFGAGLPHMFCNDQPTTDREDDAQSRYVQFREDCFGEKFFHIPELHSIAGLLRRASRGLCFRGLGESNAFKALFSGGGVSRLTGLLRLLDELAHTPSGETLASDGYVPLTSTRSSERLERALTHIHRSVTTGINLADTARAATMSPEAFSRFFRRHLGKTFQDYVTDLRVAEACRLLLGTDLTAAQVCFRAGFNNLANFNRHFLRRKGTSPSQYRKLAENLAG